MENYLGLIFLVFSSMIYLREHFFKVHKVFW